MAELIKLAGISKHYGKTRAIDGVDLTIDEGEIVGLIGPNGAGKSTLLKCILGLVQCKGDVKVFDSEPFSGRSKTLESLSYVADVASLPEWISVSRLFTFVQGVHPNFDRSRAIAYLNKTEVTLKAKVKALSKGMKTQLHLALIMGIDSRLLVLDEPTLGLDVIYRTEFYDTLAGDYFRADRSILVTTHQVEEIENYLTRVLFIQHGKIVLDIAAASIGERFSRLTLAEGAGGGVLTSLEPLYRRQTPRGTTLIFDHQGRDIARDRADLTSLGQVDSPSLTDLFVATVRGAAAHGDTTGDASKAGDAQ